MAEYLTEALTRRRLGGAVLVLIGIVVGLVVQDGRTTGAVVEIVGNLIATLVVLPVGPALAHGERTRYGSIVLAVAGVTVAVLSLRTGQVWAVTGGARPVWVGWSGRSDRRRSAGSGRVLLAVAAGVWKVPSASRRVTETTSAAGTTAAAA